MDSDNKNNTCGCTVEPDCLQTDCPSLSTACPSLSTDWPSLSDDCPSLSSSVSEGNSSGSPESVDAGFVQGLKTGDGRVCRRFFYEEIVGILHRIRVEVFDGRVSVDDLVGELYLYLSRDGWAKLEGFEARNGCRLRTWMIPVAWRYFVSIRHRLLCGMDMPLDERLSASGCDDDGGDDDLRIQVAIDVQAVLCRMPNRRYADIIRLLVLEGFAPREVADMLDIRVENVYNLKHRALAQFAELYGNR